MPCFLACADGRNDRTTPAHLHRRASVRDLWCEGFQRFTTKVVTNPLLQFLSSQQPSRFDHRSFAMDPFRLDPVEPGALGGQPARNDAYSCLAVLSLVQHGLMVLTQPSSHLLTHPAWEALSQMSTKTPFPFAWTCSHSHCRKSVVTPLPGGPDTKRRCMLPLVPPQQDFLPHAEGGRSSGSTQTLSKLSVGAQRIHDGLRQQVAPGRRRVDVTGKRGGRQHNE